MHVNDLSLSEISACIARLSQRISRLEKTGANTHILGPTSEVLTKINRLMHKKMLLIKLLDTQIDELEFN